MQNTNAPAQLYHLSEVAGFTRAPLSTVRYWVATKRLRSLKFGRRRMVLAADLAAFVSGATAANDPRGIDE
ncbi:MAG TPA: hypothetical protein VGC79_12360 [Polyangiaceae bacterium]